MKSDDELSFQSADDDSRLIEMSTGLMFGLDVEGIITDWNDQAVEITGFEKVEVIGQNFVRTLINEDLQSMAQSMLAKALRGETRVTCTLPFFTKSGERRDLIFNATARHSSSGTVIGVICNAQELSLERQTHAEQDMPSEWSVLQTANVPIIGLDLDGIVTEWNWKTANLLECNEDEAIGRHLVSDVIQPDDQTSVNDVIEKALSGVDTENFKLNLKTKFGKSLTIYLNTSTRRDARGRVIGVLGVIQDITSFQRLMDESKRMADNLKTLLEMANVPIIGIDKVGHVTEWNTQASCSFGYTKEEALGQSFVEKFVSEDMESSVRAVLNQAQMGQDTAKFDVSLSIKDGKRKDILLSTAARCGPDGDVIGVMCVGQEAQDITEMDAISEERQRVADNMSWIFENANALIFVTNAEGVVTDWNQKAVQMSGYSKEEVVGQRFTDRFNQTDSQQALQAVFSAAASGVATESYELPLRSKQGKDFTVLLNTIPRRDSKGKMIGLVGVGQDINTLQQDIKQLKTITAERESVADDLSRLIETANAPIFGVDLNGLVTEFNRKAADMLAFTKEESMGKKMVEQLIQPEHRERVQEVFEMAFSGVETADFELPLISKHGKQYTVLLNATPRRDANDAVTGVIGVGQDITALNRAMAESKRVAADLNRLISSANAPIFGIDNCGNVTIWNEKTAEITGFLSSEAMGKHLVRVFIDEEHQASVNEVLSKALEGKESTNYELPLFTKSGDQRKILLNATAQRSAGGEVIGVVGVGQDVTEFIKASAESKLIADDLTRLIETANAPIFGIGVDGNVTEWNAKAVSLLGYSKEETMGKSLVNNFITDEFRESVNSVLNAALHGEETANFEFPLFTKNSQRIDILLNATTRRGQKGEVVGVIGVGQDITNMRAAVAEQERIADDLSRLIETANAPIFGVDTKGMVTEWNQKAVSLLGYGKEETMGKSLVNNFISKEFRDSVNSVLMAALHGEETANFEFPLFTKDAHTKIDILLNATTRRGPKGEVVGVIGVGQDITEMRAAISDKERIADDLSRLIETANAPIFGVDINGMVTEWNQKAVFLIGYSKEETMGKSLVDNFITEDYRESVKSVLKATLLGQEAANFNLPLYTKNNRSRVDILLNATQRRGPNGEVVGVIGVGQDITEMRAANEEKERIADDLSRLIETANAPIFGVDMNGLVTEWNQKAVSLLGYSKDETMGKSLVDNFITGEFRESVNSVLRAALRGQETANFEFPLFTKDQHTRIDILLNATTRRGPGGDVVGVIGVGQDITEMRAAIGEKERIADDLSRLIETANAPIFGVDVNGMVTEWNQKAVSLLGYSKEETMGKSLVDNFITDKFRESVNSVLKAALRGQETANFEFPLFTKDDQTRIDVLLNATTRLGPTGEVVGVIGVGQDITEMRAAIGEKERIADDLSRLIETANAPIFGVDVNGMVTEWNQKAASLLGYGKVETMGKSLVDNFITDEFRESVNSVLRAALRGQETANFEFPLFTKERETRIDILLNATTRRGPTGEVVGVIGVGQDITSWRAAIGEKERIADDLSRLIETANAPIFGVDVNGLVTEWNQKAASLLGYGKEETMGKSLVDNFITDEFRESVSSVIRAALRGQETANFEFPLFTKIQKTRVDILLNATTRLGPTGEVVGVIGVGQDITEMRAAIGEKERIADDLSRLIETANAPIFGVDVNGMVTEWNQKAVSLLGYSKEETMGKSLVDNFITGEFRASVDSVLRAALQGQETANYEFPLFTKEDHTRVDILLNATTRRGPKGEVVGVIGVGQDITEMRAAVGEKERIADDLSRLIETANAPIFGVDLNGMVTEWNQKAASLLGYSKEETMGQSLVDNFITEEFRESVSSVLTAASQGEEKDNFEFPLFTKSCKRIDILLNATTRRGQKGEVVGVIGVGQDITEMRAANADKVRIADDLSRLIETANAPIFGVDSNGMVTEWNQKAASLIGWSKEETMGKSLVDNFITGEFRESVSAVLTAALQGQETANFEFPLFTKKDQTRIDVLLNATTRRGPEGEVVGVIGVGQDITDMRAAVAEQERIADDLSRLIETANAPIFGVDMKGMVTEWNQKAVSLLGYSKEETMGKNLVANFITDESSKAVSEVLTAAQNGEETANFEFPLYTKSSHRIDILLNATTRRGPKGEVVGVIGVGQDITKMRAAVAEQERIADDLSRLIETANAPIFGVDINGMVTEWNQKAANLLGFSKEETMGQSLVDNFITQEFRESVNSVLAAALQGVETANFEFPLFTKSDQTRIDILLNATTRRGTKGEVVGVVGVGQDITKMRAAVAEQERIADDLSRLIETANAPIFGVDMNGMVTEWNQKAASLLGYSKEETMGKNLVDNFIAVEWRESVSSVLASALQGEEKDNFEFPLFTKSQQRIDILLNATTRRGNKGEVVGVIGVGQDITKMRAAVAEQERIADDLSRLIETANAPIFGVDMNGMVTEWNQKAASLLGYSKEETMGKSLVDNFITLEFRESVSSVLTAALQGEETANFEFPLFTKAKQRIDILLNATTRRGQKGEVIGVIGVGQDITEMRAAVAAQMLVADDLSRLIATANAPIFGVDTNGMVTEWNQKAASLLGYSKEDTMGKSLVENFITEEFMESVNSVLNDALHGDETANFEFPLFNKQSDQRVDILLNATTRRGKMGEVVGVIGVGQDITKMRAAVAEQERIADDLSRLIETANAPIFGVDVNGLVTEWNQKAASLLGYSPQETMGKSLVGNFITEEFREEVSSVLQAALNGQESANFEFPIFTKEHQKVDILLNATTRRGPKGEVVGVIGVGQDITEMRAAVAEQMRVADDLSRLIESANAPIFGVDLNGLVTEWNQKAASLLGFSKEETMGQSLVNNFITEEFRDSVSSVLTAALQGQETANFEFPVFTKSCQRIDILLNATTRRGQKGEVVGMIGVGQDITKMRAAVAEQERIADDLSRLIETANAPIFGVDVNGMVTEWNQKAAYLLGYSKEETMGKSLVDNFITEEFRESVNEVLAAALTGRETANFEFPLLTKGCHRIDILLNSTTRRGPQGEVVGVIGVGQDITEMRAAVAEQSRVADDLSRLIETANAPIFGVDMNGTVTEWNQKAASLLGYSKEETMGQSLVDNFITEEFREQVSSVLNAALQGEEKDNFEFPLFTKSCKRIDILLNATTRRGQKGEVVGVIGVGQDITEMRAANADKVRIADDLSRLIETANAPIFGVDSNGMVTEWNQKAASLLGYSKEETMGQSLVDNFITEEFRESVSSVLSAALQGEEKDNFEFPLFTKSCKRIDILLNATTRRGQKGEVVGVIGVGQDITEMRAANADKVRIADDLSRLIETANAPIFGVDSNGMVTEWNQKAASLLGFSKEETMGHSLVDNFITEEFRESVNAVLNAALQGQETANFEFPLFTKSRQRIDILLNATTRRGQEGEVVGVIGVGQDITEMRSAVAERMHVADDLSRLIETANAPIFGVDRHGMVTEWNQKAASLLGYSKEETMGQSLVNNFITEDLRESVNEVLMAALDGKETANFEFPLFKKTSRQRIDILLNATTRRGQKGEVVGVIGVGQDITEMRAAVQEQVRVADDLSRLIETANAPIFGVDVNGMVTEWNQKAASLLGRSKEETMGKSLVDNFITEEFRESVSSVLTAALNGEETANFEFPLFSKSLRRIDILLNATTRRGPNFEVVGVIGVGQDITEMCAANDEKARIADDLSRLIETANAPIFGVDTMGMVTEWNAKAASLLGRGKAETMGKHLVDNFITDEFRDSVNSVLTAALNGRETANFEFPLFTKSGRRLDILLNATTRLGPTGEVVGVIGVGQDITDMRAAMSENKRIADDLSRLIETANAPIFGVDNNGMVTEWNQKAVNMLGYTKDEVMSKNFVQNFIQPEYRHTVSEVLHKATNGVETANFELLLLSKYGKQYMVLLNATTRRDSEGKVTGVVGVGQDITELNKAVAQSKQAADDLTRLIATANAPIFGIDVEGKLITWNKKTAAITGIPQSGALGRSLVQNFIHEDFRQSVEEVLSKALNGEETEKFELPLFTKGGDRREILLNATAQRSASGAIIGVVGVGQDITELKQASLQSKSIAEDLTRLIETANAPIFGIDTAYRVTEWNTKAANVTGYTKDEAVGNHLVNTFLDLQCRSSVLDVLTTALYGEGSANVELILFTKCGQKRDVLLNATPRRGPDGQVVGVIGVGQDITELNLQRREALRTADDLGRLIQTANAPIFGVDIQGQVTEWNDKLAELSELTKQEVLGQPLIQNFITEQYRAAMADILLKALSGVETSNFEFPLVKNGRQTALLLLNATTRRGPSGNIIGVIGVGQDITQIRAITAEHQRVADDLSRLIENANAPIFGVDPNGVVTEWNKKAAELSGYSKSEAMGVELVKNFIQPEDQKSVNTVLEKALKGAETANYSLPLVSKTGQCSTVLLNATTRRNAKGNITGVIGVGQDITTLNKIMAETQLIADDLKRFVETANAPIFGIDTHGNVTEWNRMTAYISQFSKEAALGKPLVQNFIDQEYTQKVSSVLNRALKGIETANFEFQLNTSEDSKIQILANATPRRGPDGSIIGVIGVGQDVTHLRDAKARAESTADELARFIEFANAPIFGVDRHGRITEWNRMMGRVSGVPRDEALGVTLVDYFLLDKNSKNTVSKVLRDAMEGVEIEHFELRLKKRAEEMELDDVAAGGKIDFAVLLINATARLNAAGEITGVTGVGQDITEITSYKALEERKMRFIAMVSHELGSPIHGINGLAESLGETETDPKRRKQLGLIRSCASRLIGLVTAIMDYAFMKAKTFKLNVGVCHIPSVMEEIVELLHHAIDKHGRPVKRQGVRLINDMDPSTPEIQADAHRCTQVFHNLVMNALKFTTQGSVRVTSNYHKDEWVQVHITDTGIGIDKRHVERIFEPFEQEDDSDTRVFQGIGLGLPISRELVRRHGGDILVRTEVGKGSTFTVTLPVRHGSQVAMERHQTMTVESMATLPEIHEAESSLSTLPDYTNEDDDVSVEDATLRSSFGHGPSAVPTIEEDKEAVEPLTPVSQKAEIERPVPSAEEHKEGESTFREPSQEDTILAHRASIETAEKFLAPWGTDQKATILVVDDSPVNQEVIFQILTADGYLPQRAMSGQEALAKLTGGAHLPDLILLDVSMPEMSGVQVCEQIRNEMRLSASELKIIMMSAKVPLVQTCVDCLAAGANDFIARPFAHEEFRARVRSMLNLTNRAWRPMPNHIQKRLLTGERKIIEQHKKVSFLFAGIADWSEISDALTAKQIIKVLELFAATNDKLATKYDAFQIESGGEVCIAVAGHDGKGDHCRKLVRMALEMLQAVAEVRMPQAHKKLRICVGIHTGPAWSGVLQNKIPQYCFFDYTLKVAARLEAVGVSDWIHISQTALEDLQDALGRPSMPTGVRCDEWSVINVKGKGHVPTFLVGRGQELPPKPLGLEAKPSPTRAKEAGDSMMTMFAGDPDHEKLERQMLQANLVEFKQQVASLRSQCRSQEETRLHTEVELKAAAAQVELLRQRLQASEEELSHSKEELGMSQRKGQHLSLSLEMSLARLKSKTPIKPLDHTTADQPKLLT